MAASPVSFLLGAAVGGGLEHGTKVQSGPHVQGYPVDRLLVSVWSPLYPKNLAITALKKRAPPPLSAPA